LREACSKCFAYLFTDRAISYRVDCNFDHFEVALSIGVMKMVRSDLSASGVIFTLDPESGFRDIVVITASYGLGENIVQGTVNPDEYYVFKATFNTGHRAIIRKTLGRKEIKMVYGSRDSMVLTRNVEVTKADRRRFCDLVGNHSDFVFYSDGDCLSMPFNPSRRAEPMLGSFESLAQSFLFRFLRHGVRKETLHNAHGPVCLFD
jgi:hypothetical protein